MKNRAFAVSIWSALIAVLPSVCFGQASLRPQWVKPATYNSSWAAGHEANGAPLYVCRASYNGGVHPGKVVAGSCNIGWGGKEIVLHSFEVLSTNALREPGIWTSGIVPGHSYYSAGHEANGTSLYICRASYRGGLHPGKVVAGKCNFGWGGNEIALPAFEVLTTGFGAPQAEFTAAAANEPVAITGSYKHNSPPGQWSRGMATTMYCGNSPESWVRGNAVFDRSSGMLSMAVQLETDSTSAGPKGRVLAVFKDSAGNELATATSSEIGTGGKPPGHSAIRNFTSQTTVPQQVASRIASIYLDAQCTGSIDRLWNVKLGTVKDAFNIGVMVAAAF